MSPRTSTHATTTRSLARPSPTCRLASTLLASALLFGAVPRAALAQGVAIEQATDAQKKDAQGHYEAGARAFAAKRFDEAFSEFSESYRVVRSPNAHLMMARALAEIGQHARAYNELLAVEVEATGVDRYAQALERSRGLRAELAPKVALLTVRVTGPPPGPVVVAVNDANAPIDAAQAYAPGPAVVKLTMADRVVDEKRLELGAGKEATLELATGPVAPPAAPPAAPPVAPPVAPPPPVEPPEEPGGVRVDLLATGIALGVVGLGGLGVGTALQLGAQSDHDELASLCTETGGGYACPDTQQVADLKESGPQQQTFATVAFISGGVLTGLGAALVTGGIVAGGGGSGEAALPVRVHAGPGWVGLSGRF